MLKEDGSFQQYTSLSVNDYVDDDDEEEATNKKDIDQAWSKFTDLQRRQQKMRPNFSKMTRPSSIIISVMAPVAEEKFPINAEYELGSGKACLSFTFQETSTHAEGYYQYRQVTNVGTAEQEFRRVFHAHFDHFLDRQLFQTFHRFAFGNNIVLHEFISPKKNKARP